MKPQLIATLVAGLSVGIASAQSSVVFSVSASNGNGSASFSVSAGDMDGLVPADLSSPVDWTLESPVELRDDETGELIAVLDGANAGLDPELNASNNSSASSNSTLGADPEINLSFSVIAGAADTTFNISSAEIMINPAQENVEGQATAGITLTDGNGDGDATMTGLVEGSAIGPAGRTIAGSPTPPTSIYGAFFDDDTSDTEITPFAFLIDSPVTTATTTAIEESEPPTPPDFANITGFDPIEAISTQFSFTLSAGDLASGTSRFTLNGDLVPAPSGAAAILFACGVIGHGRRRR
mgnify:CR=1 FL=1